MPATIGQQLKEARQELGLTLEQASEATHIRLHYLQALEVDDYSVMPSAAQARGFLRNYASALGLDLDALVEKIQRAGPADSRQVSGPLPQVDLPPGAPEPAPTERLPGTRPDRSRWGLDAGFFRLKKRATAPEAGEEEGPASTAEVHAPERPGLATEEAPTVPVRRAAPQQQAEPREQAAGGTSLLRRLGVLLRPRKPKEQAEAAKDVPVEEAGAETPDESTAPPEPAENESAQNGGVGIETAEEIFREIGGELRRRRELLSLTLEEVERHIHIKVAFIQALESGDFDQLPSAVQTRGMLANYATFLDLDTDSLLLRFADSLQASHRARYPDMPGRSRQPLSVRPTLPPLRSFVAGDMIFGLAVVVMVVALVVWGLGRVFAVQAQPVSLPTAPSISDVLAGTDVPTLVSEVTLIPVADTPLSTGQAPEQAQDGTATADAALEIPAFNSDVAVSVTIVATERTFMRVAVDGEEVFNGRVVPGTAYPYEATTSIQVLTGNGAALRATYNGRDLGLLGTFGEVVNFIYTADSIVTPVPPASPTVSPTPDLSPTPSPTPTSTATPTPTAAATGTATGG